VKPGEEYSYLREIGSPLTAEQLRPLDARCRCVQFSKPLASHEYPALAEFLRAYPQVPLRMYGHYGLTPDLEFLRHFSFLSGFQVDVLDLSSFDGLRHLPENLTSLALGQTRSRRHSLTLLSRFPALRELYIEGHAKDFTAVGDLKQLRTLTLRSVTLPDLDVLTTLPELRSLALKLGGTTNLACLPRIALRYLEVWMVRGLADLAVIAQLEHLQYLFLQSLKNVRRLPSLAALTQLRRVHLETMRGLTDLEPVAEAPALEELLVLDMRQLDLEAFRPFLAHRALRAALIVLGSENKNAAVEAMLGLQPATRIWNSDFVYRL
jgi:hypothetical protein